MWSFSLFRKLTPRENGFEDENRSPKELKMAANQKIREIIARNHKIEVTEDLIDKARRAVGPLVKDDNSFRNQAASSSAEDVDIRNESEAA